VVKGMRDEGIYLIFMKRAIFKSLDIMEPVISIVNLDHYFGQGQLRKQVLYDINLKINAGEIIIMTGPSGSGKTTLLTLCGGLRATQSGSLKVLG
jgi:putative ABC transport system ATP-binding protein